MAKEKTPLGMPIGINDRKGNPIHIGDALSFDADEWGEPMEFTVRLEHGQIQHPGATDDLSAFCEIVCPWNQKK